MNFIRKILIKFLFGKDFLSEESDFFRICKSAIYEVVMHEDKKLKSHIDQRIEALTSHAMDQFKSRTLSMIKDAVKLEVAEYIKTEYFIDRVVEKINTKQIR